MIDASYEIGQILLGRLPKGSDLLSGLTDVVKNKAIRSGIIWAIGALESVRLAYYEQNEKRYSELKIEKGVEILSLVGNISEKEGVPFIHAHITVGDKENVWGGHLIYGSKVFAVEYHIIELKGRVLSRTFDPETGLFLWQRETLQG